MRGRDPNAEMTPHEIWRRFRDLKFRNRLSDEELIETLRSMRERLNSEPTIH